MVTDQAWLERNKKWEDKDTDVCTLAEQRPTAINRLTGKPITWEEIKTIHNSLPY